MTDIFRYQPPLLIAELQRPGTVFAVDEKRFVWRGEFGDGELNIEEFETGQLHRPVDPATGIRQVATVQWLQDALTKGTLRILVHADSSAPEATKGPPAELDRDEMLAYDPHAEARQILLQELHAAGAARNDPELSQHVGRIWSDKLEHRFGDRPATSTVRDWMTWTDPAIPCLSQLLSHSGRVSRAKRLDPLVREIVEKRTDWYWGERGRQIKDAEAAGNADLRALNTERHAQGLPALKLPSREAYRRAIRASECRENYERKYGKIAADRHWHPSASGRLAKYALELVYMDDTVLDAVACIQSRDGQRFPAGRPYIVVAFDLYSRCAPGWVLSFKPPTTHTAAECLKRAGREKTRLSADWSSRYPVLTRIAGKPTQIVVDNGSNYISPAFQEALAEAGITLGYAPIRSPKSKAAIERFFRTLKTWLLQKLPGHTLDPKTLRELNYDPSTKAVLLVEELEALIQEFINTYHVSLHSGINEQPAAAWLRSIEARGGRPILNERALDVITHLTVHGRRLTANGVRWQHLIYRGDDLKRLLDANVPRERMRSRLKDTAAATVKIKVDPENVGHIWVFDPSSASYVELRATQQDYAWNLTLDQHQQALAWAKRRNAAFNTEDERMAVLHALNEFIEEVIPHAGARKLRALARHTQGQIGEAEPDVPIRHTDASHDGMGDVIVQDSAADRLDWNVRPNRPATGVTASGGSHDSDPRQDWDHTVFDPETGLFTSPEDDDERYEGDYS